MEKEKENKQEESLKDYFAKRCVDVVLRFSFWLFLGLFIFTVGVPFVLTSIRDFMSEASAGEVAVISLLGIF